MTTPADDWRLTGQQRYLADRLLRWTVWTPYRDGWSHDHCAFCYATFGPASAPDTEHTSGYVTADDGYHWICTDCVRDFQALMRWTVEPPPRDPSLRREP